ncbi:FG-GAP-like repeat-containing protein [Brasilonema sp. UFV-L1]|uniref:FG-GAP-like repeat-containing protein n=1 Tax=Brasilonema sp. UFV-L1 TaxID=2234130 RepID=UPI00145DF048|nr:FG-GAP-like repeat-containing protein [Brasilonema sp. UFV-L1]
MSYLSTFTADSLVKSQEIVFIDKNLEDYHLLVNGVTPGIEVIVLDGQADGVAQITTALQARPQMSSIHIVAHGTPGCLYLGNSQLSLDTLDQYSAQLQTWFSLCSNPQLHLYGCQVAAGDAGAEFLSQLHELTGASIAASQKRVGNAARGGSWQLQQHIGEGEVTSAFTPELMQSYSGVFSVTFSTASNYAVGSFSVNVTTGDLNGDGKPDLAVVNFNDNTVSVLLNNGNGTFGTASNFAVGSNPVSVTTGDFDGDGKLDLAVANNNSNNVSVLLNNGSGTFGTPSNFAVGSGPFSVTTGDFNGDGKPDLAVANISSNNVSVLLNNGNDTFGTASNFAVGSGPFSVTTGDFNGDGKPDLAVANISSNNVSVLLNNGNDTFGTASNFAVESSPVSVTTGDLNGDGKPDLAVANFRSNNVSVLLNNGSGGFGTASNFEVGPGSESVTTGDFNGDGKLDLAVAKNNSNNVSVLLGNGSGDFGSATNFAVGSTPYSVTTGDFDGDGKLDLAVANSGSNNVSVLLNTTNRPPVAVDDTATTRQNTAVTLSVTTLLANDTDPDGNPLSITAVGNATNGTVTLNDNSTPGNTSDDLITFSPTADFSGDASFEYTLSDGNGGTDTGLVKVIVGTVQFGSGDNDNLIGNDGNDILYGNGGVDTLIGNAGDDLIYGGSQADTIFAGLGNDTIYANGGNDRINSGSGLDTVWLGSGEATVVLSLGDGYDTINNFQLGLSQLSVGNLANQLSFADSEQGVRISAGDDLLAVVSNQTASSFSSNVNSIFV